MCPHVKQRVFPRRGMPAAFIRDDPRLRKIALLSFSASGPGGDKWAPWPWQSILNLFIVLSRCHCVLHFQEPHCRTALHVLSVAERCFERIILPVFSGPAYAHLPFILPCSTAGFPSRKAPSPCGTQSGDKYLHCGDYVSPTLHSSVSPAHIGAPVP